MKQNFICLKKSVRTFKLRIEPYFLSHAERGEPFQIQDFLGGIHLCRHFVPAPIRLQNAISISGGDGEIRTLDALSDIRPFQGRALDRYANPPRYLETFVTSFLNARPPFPALGGGQGRALDHYANPPLSNCEIYKCSFYLKLKQTFNLPENFTV